MATKRTVQPDRGRVEGPVARTHRRVRGSRAGSQAAIARVDGPPESPPAEPRRPASNTIPRRNSMRHFRHVPAENSDVIDPHITVIADSDAQHPPVRWPPREPGVHAAEVASSGFTIAKDATRSRGILVQARILIPSSGRSPDPRRSTRSSPRTRSPFARNDLVDVLDHEVLSAPSINRISEIRSSSIGRSCSHAFRHQGVVPSAERLPGIELAVHEPDVRAAELRS